MGVTLDDLIRRVKQNSTLLDLNPALSGTSQPVSAATQHGLALALIPKSPHDSGNDPQALKSNGEREMRAWLEIKRQEGGIHSFDYEAITLSVGEPKCRYTPDFAVWRHDGSLILIEVKGKKKWEDSIIKFKSARKQYPKITFQMWEFSKGKWREIYAE